MPHSPDKPLNARVGVTEAFAGGKVVLTNEDGETMRLSVSPGVAAEARRLFGTERYD